MKTVDWNQLHENLKAEVERIGFHYISDRPLSTHPDDWYLRFASGYKKIGNRTEYASWVYNATLGETGSLNSGHYLEDHREAFHDYITRR